MANKEHGSWPGGTVATVLWHVKNGEYEGGYEWLNETWLAQRGRNDPSEAIAASPQQQAEVFIRNVRGMGGWPSGEIAECGG